VLAAAALAVLAVGVAPSQVDQIRVIRDELESREAFLGDLRAVLRSERTRLNRCHGVYVASHAYKSFVAYQLGRAPDRVEPTFNGPPPPSGIVVAPATDEILKPAGLTPEYYADLTRRLERRFETVASNERWVLYGRGC
jgi:hypothetical protein